MKLPAALLPALCLTLCLPLNACDDGDDGGGSDEHDGDSEGHHHEDGDTDGETHGDTDGDTDGDETGGAGDAQAQAACALFESGTPTELIAATSAGEAATAAFVPGAETVYQVTLPEGAAGYIQLQIADWETTQAFFTDVAIDYTVTTDAQGQELGAREPNAACPEAGVSDQRIFFPHWTPATVEFSAEGPREILLMVIEEG